MYCTYVLNLIVPPQLWMMRGQIEEQQGNTDTAREIYNRAVSTSHSIYITHTRTHTHAHTHTHTHCWCTLCNDGPLFVCLVEEGSSRHLTVAAAGSLGGKLWAFDKGKYNNTTSAHVQVYNEYMHMDFHCKTNLLSPFISSVCQQYTSDTAPVTYSFLRQGQYLRRAASRSPNALSCG